MQRTVLTGILVVQNECHHHINAEFHDFSVFDGHFLLFYPHAGDAAQGFRGAFDAFLDSVIKAFFEDEDISVTRATLIIFSFG